VFMWSCSRKETNPWAAKSEPLWPAPRSAEPSNRSVTWWSGGGELLHPLKPFYVTTLDEDYNVSRCAMPAKGYSRRGLSWRLC
jgi:hypothetical protein